MYDEFLFFAVLGLEPFGNLPFIDAVRDICIAHLLEYIDTPTRPAARTAIKNDLCVFWHIGELLSPSHDCSMRYIDCVFSAATGKFKRFTNIDDEWFCHWV